MLLTCVLWFLVVQRYRYLLENGEKGGSAVRQYGEAAPVLAVPVVRVASPTGDGGLPNPKGLGVSSSRVTAVSVALATQERHP
jgi:hypothetical protein